MTGENAVVRSEVRRGAYYDSIVLMQLQVGLAALDGVHDAGAVMATEANLALLETNGLRPAGTGDTAPDDLLVVVKADGESAAAAALAEVDGLLARRRATTSGEYRPKSLEAAIGMLPDARWALVSVPGRYAAGLAEAALDRGRHVFLYSDNVALEDEAALKRKAREKGLLVMGPDCGTAIVGGTGLGFANRVRRGSIGLVGASGTGIQAITSYVHALGAGISHAIGTGGRDLHADVGAITAHQGLDLLARDPATRVIVLVSKPPSPRVAARLLAAARSAGKPVVVDFIGYPSPGRRIGSLCFASTLHEAATLAVELAEEEPQDAAEVRAPSAGYLRGLFSGGTLAYEVVQGLKSFLEPMYSNVSMEGVEPLTDPTKSHAHTVVDLGADELTVGRLHPMMDQDLCRRRLRQEASDPEVGVILLDVVLGDVAAADPAGELAPTIAEVLAERGGGPLGGDRGGKHGLEVVAIVVGTEDDPQDLEAQVERLEAAGARVFRVALRGRGLRQRPAPDSAGARVFPKSASKISKGRSKRSTLASNRSTTAWPPRARAPCRWTGARLPAVTNS